MDRFNEWLAREPIRVLYLVIIFFEIVMIYGIRG